MVTAWAFETMLKLHAQVRLPVECSGEFNLGYARKRLAQMWAKRGHFQLWLPVQFFGEFNLGYAGKKLAHMGAKRGTPSRDGHFTPQNSI